MIKRKSYLLTLFFAVWFANTVWAQVPKSAEYAPAVFTSLFDGKTLNGWRAVPADGWTVADSAIAMTGSARGFIYTNNTYKFYRIIFSVRQVKGKDHWPCQLIFGPDPKLDAMGAVQFQLPKNWTWDYRPGKNNNGNGYFSWPPVIPDFNKTDWARCEILVDAATGSAYTAVAQPIGSQAVAFTVFKDTNIPYIATAFGLQSHNKGQFDEYRDIIIEVNPKVNKLLTVLVAPTDLQAVAKSKTRIDLHWTDNADVEDGFVIERSTDNSTWTKIASVGMNVVNYADTKLKANTRYYYRVLAFNAAVVSTYASASTKSSGKK